MSFAPTVSKSRAKGKDQPVATRPNKANAISVECDDDIDSDEDFEVPVAKKWPLRSQQESQTLPFDHEPNHDAQIKCYQSLGKWRDNVSLPLAECLTRLMDTVDCCNGRLH